MSTRAICIRFRCALASAADVCSLICKSCLSQACRMSLAGDLLPHAVCCTLFRRVPPDLQKLPVPITPLAGDLAAQLNAAASVRDVGQWNPIWVSRRGCRHACMWRGSSLDSCALHQKRFAAQLSVFRQEIWSAKERCLTIAQ
jgi:hypothetical protein